MNKVTLNIDGMMCGMCESHVSEAIRKVCDKNAKVSASHKDGKAEIILEGQPDIARIKHAIKDTGYSVTGVNVEPYEKKKGFSLFKH